MPVMGAAWPSTDVKKGLGAAVNIEVGNHVDGGRPLGIRSGDDCSAPSASYQITPARNTQPLPPKRRLYGLGNLGAVLVAVRGLFDIGLFEPLRECPLPYIRAYGFPQSIELTQLTLGKSGLDIFRFRNH